MKIQAVILVSAILLGFSNIAHAEYPEHSVTVIVPFSAGGPTDTLARIVTEKMTRLLGQQFVVKNQGGAAGTVGARQGAQATPDGYTLLVGNLGAMATGVSIYKNLGYDPRDMSGIGMIAGTPTFLSVRKDLPVDNVADLVKKSKDKPESFTYGHAGIGSTSHLACLQFMAIAGIEMLPVPYPGTAPAMTDLVGGHIDVLCDQAPGVVPQVQSGTIRAIVYASLHRSEALPDVPSAKEANVVGFDLTGWNGLFAPKGTPQKIVQKLNQALNDALADKSVQANIARIGSIFMPDQATPEALNAFVKSEIVKWKTIIKDAGIQPK